MSSASQHVFGHAVAHGAPTQLSSTITYQSSLLVLVIRPCNMFVAVRWLNVCLGFVSRYYLESEKLVYLVITGLAAHIFS